MKHGLYELMNIADQADPRTKDLIKMWIRFNIDEAHVLITQSRPFNDEEAKYRIESSKHELGKLIADRSNMYPTWQENKDGTRTMRMSAIVFKNEFGK